MKNEKIEQELRGWFTQMLEKYTWLSIKFEYNSRRGCFMVSFSPESIINQDEEFCKEALAFEEKLDEEYRDEAPLFCDGDSLFKLSSDAEILSRNQASISFKKVNDESSIKWMNFDFTNMFEQKSQQYFATEVSPNESHYNNNIAA